jgi:hypothetical protein
MRIANKAAILFLLLTGCASTDNQVHRFTVYTSCQATCDYNTKECTILCVPVAP